MQAEFNKSIKVFSKLYVGFRLQGKDQSLLGFATPYEDNAAGRKRQATVDSWSEFRYYNSKDKKIDPKIIDNIPREGFKITDDIKRVYWGGGNVVFRVLDPAGFELEIQSHNLMTLINIVGVEAGGNIPGKCIWGRDGAINVLLHESSEEYKNAILAAETIKKPKEILSKDKIIGSTYKLLDGSDAIYLGKFWTTAKEYNDNRDTQSCRFMFRGTCFLGSSCDNPLRIKSSEQYEAVLVDKEVRFYKKSPLIQLLKEDVMSPEEAEKLIFPLRKSFASSSKGGEIVHASLAKSNSFKYSMRNWTQNEFDEQVLNLQYTWQYDLKHVLSRFLNTYPNTTLLRVNDKFFGNTFSVRVEEFSVTHYGNRIKEEVDCIGLIEFSDNNFTIISSNFYYGSSYSRMRNPVSADQVSKSPVEVFELPILKDRESIEAWYTEQFKAGNLFKIIVVSGD